MNKGIINKGKAHEGTINKGKINMGTLTESKTMRVQWIGIKIA